MLVFLCVYPPEDDPWGKRSQVPTNQEANFGLHELAGLFCWLDSLFLMFNSIISSCVSW